MRARARPMLRRQAVDAHGGKPFDGRAGQAYGRAYQPRTAFWAGGAQRDFAPLLHAPVADGGRFAGEEGAIAARALLCCTWHATAAARAD